MAKRNRVTRRKHFVERVRQIARHEGPALFICVAMIAGAAAFCAMVSRIWDIGVDWKWIAVIASLVNLPRAFAKLKDSKEPYTIRFARAFREGFLSLSSAAPNLAKGILKVRGFWKHLNRKA